jgi:hypothetical protein
VYLATWTKEVVVHLVLMPNVSHSLREIANPMREAWIPTLSSTSGTLLSGIYFDRDSAVSRRTKRAKIHNA